MAQIDALVASTEISSSTDKFYGFFRNDMSELVNVFPDSYKSVELIHGEEGSVGSVKLWTYVLGKTVQINSSIVAMLESFESLYLIQRVSIECEVGERVKLEIDANEGERSITFKAIEGDVLLLYKNYKFTIDVSDGSVQWTIEYEKAFATSPPPDAYAGFAIMTFKLLDLYLLSH
ncbi:hypothetical protein BUALT_Bualt04G0090900 [Buddleja alternifolia]|uniref:Bet v I/Major latex protein domain-containing protein n=1 Tax=Buddleja alternifolia TaxID=168488 RepID=A0AAV6XMG0_9LAMI|nr:hypothetical protein BUALT_Bualt04G0090900 [Buddleja alternifolia]